MDMMMILTVTVQKGMTDAVSISRFGMSRLHSLVFNGLS
jgi:hypothetical protein